MRVAAGHQAEAAKIADELAAIARTGMILPGSITERRNPLRAAELRLPRRPVRQVLLVSLWKVLAGQ